MEQQAGEDGKSGKRPGRFAGTEADEDGDAADGFEDAPRPGEQGWRRQADRSDIACGSADIEKNFCRPDMMKITESRMRAIRRTVSWSFGGLSV